MYQGDVLVDGEKITTIGASLSMPADRVIDASGKYVFPGGIDVHTHLDMPFGGTTSADDFESGTIAAAHGGTTTIVDFAIQYRGQTLHHAWETWMKKAEGKAAIDYGFHMIITELTDQVELEMDALVRQGVTSFKLFMAYPGVFMLDDASIFRALLRTGKNGGTICMHAENGGVIDVLVKQALAEGKTAPKYHALTRPARAEAEATHRAIALAEIADVPIYIVHLSAAEALEMVTEARDRGLPALRRDVPAVSLPVVRQLRGARLRRRQVRHEPAAPAEGTQDGCGEASPSTTFRRSRRIIARSALHAERAVVGGDGLQVVDGEAAPQPSCVAFARSGGVITYFAPSKPGSS